MAALETPPRPVADAIGCNVRRLFRPSYAFSWRHLVALVPTLNDRAQRLADYLAANATLLRVAVHTTAGARVIDCGVKAPGGLQAGLGLARVCLAGLAEVTLIQGEVGGVACPHVVVSSDTPIAACMASQYAGWQVSVGKFFAMGSGPMRAAYGKEDIFADIGLREKPAVAVGTLESRKLPDDAVIDHLRQALEIPANKLTLCVAPAASCADTSRGRSRAGATALPVKPGRVKGLSRRVDRGEPSGESRRIQRPG